ATAVIVTNGSESASNFTINWTSDTYAANQLVTLTATDSSHWVVSGSSTSANVTIANNGTASWPSTNAQVNITIGNATATAGDSPSFGLIAGSKDAGLQKKLQFGPITGSSFNSGRSKIDVAPGGGLVVTGISGTPTTVDMLSGGTYYT